MERHTVGLAAGVHWRVETEELNPDGFALTGISLGGDELIGLNAGESVQLQATEETTKAAFVEASITPLAHPKFGTMEVQAAARYAESVETAGGAICPRCQRQVRYGDSEAGRALPTDQLGWRCAAA